MLGIYTMMLVVLAAGIILWGGLIFYLNGMKTKALWLLLAGLPLSALANVAIETPLIHGLASRADVPLTTGSQTPWWFVLFLLFLPAVIEEPLKLLPLLLPGARRWLRSDRSAIWIGLALGVSFGLGEAAFLAYNIAKSSTNAALPASVFINYALERWLSCLLYGLMSALFLLGIRRGGWRILTGYLAAVGLHALVKSSALFTQIGVLPQGAARILFYLEFCLAVLLLAWLWNRAKAQPVKIIRPTSPQNAS
jgi:hypothetical protein